MDADFAPRNIGRRANVTPGELQQARGSGLLRRFRYSRFWEAVGPMIPSRVRSVGRELFEKKVNRSSMTLHEVISYLRPLQQVETAELREMLGREFPEWKTLYGNPASTVKTPPWNNR